MISPDECTVLAKALELVPYMREIAFIDNNMYTTMGYFLYSIKTMNSFYSNNLEKFTISNDNFKDVSFYKELGKISRIYSLKEIDLSANFLNALVLKYFSDGIMKDISKLEAINFSGNDFDYSDMEDFGPFFEKLTFLKKVDLTNNPITNGGLKKLIEAVKISKSLTSVELDEDQYDGKLISQLYEILDQNK